MAFLDGRRPPKQQPGEAGEAAADAAAAPDLICPHYTPADLEVARADLAGLAGDVDLLLTCQWPAGVLACEPPANPWLRAPSSGARRGQRLAPAHPRTPPPHARSRPAPRPAPGMQPSACASAPADLAVLARPRYHVAGGQGVFYARLPYTNPDLGAGPRATRFVGLAHVGNASKQKFLHALQLAPAAGQSPEQLAALPEGSTASPYTARKDGKRPAADAAAVGSPKGGRSTAVTGGGGSLQRARIAARAACGAALAPTQPLFHVPLPPKRRAASLTNADGGPHLSPPPPGRPCGRVDVEGAKAAARRGRRRRAAAAGGVRARDGVGQRGR
jgi:hypothetical protein